MSFQGGHYPNNFYIRTQYYVRKRVMIIKEHGEFIDSQWNIQSRKDIMLSTKFSYPHCYMGTDHAIEYYLYIYKSLTVSDGSTASRKDNYNWTEDE